MQKGLVHIYTGTGKGKTTSSVGLAVRAISHNKNVCYSFFNKNPSKYGYTEVNTLEKLGAKIVGITKGHPSFNKKIIIEEHKQETIKGFDELVKLVTSEHIDLLIMDEINISVRDGYLPEEHLISFMKNKPEHLELVLTGRGATQNLIEHADYVSVIEAVKHPMNNGIPSREGIEF